MAHVQAISYTSPEYHRRMARDVGRWKYPVIGPIYKGWYRPYHSELYFDDFRIPEICVPQFVSDMELGDFEEKSFMRQKSFISRLFRIAMLLFRAIGPWKRVDDIPKKKMHEFNPWRVSVLVGKIDDSIRKTQHDGKWKEVL